MIGRALLAAWAVLLAAHARAFDLRLEAWPTPASEICAAPCYQTRIFLDDPSRIEQIQAIFLEVTVRQGAEVSPLAVPPASNPNAGSGNLRVATSGVGNALREELLPWNLAATAGRTLSGDVGVSVASESRFSVDSLTENLDAVTTTCIDDPARCALVLDALARNSIYVGFFNVTVAHPLVNRSDFCGDGSAEDPYCGPPPAGPYFVVRLGQFIDRVPSDAVITTPGDRYHTRNLYVPLMPEPAVGLLLGWVCSILALGRGRSTYPSAPESRSLAMRARS